MKRKSSIVPEFQTRTKKPRCGFVPGYDSEIEVWQVWCRRADDSDDARRATVADLRKAGFVRKAKR